MPDLTTEAHYPCCEHCGPKQRGYGHKTPCVDCLITQASGACHPADAPCDPDWKCRTHLGAGGAEVAASEALAVRFWSKVMKTDACWFWVGNTYWDGYGQFHVDGKMVRAHRWSYEQAKGAIPDGLVIDHLCRTRACVNPDHLEAITNAENVLRGIGLSAQNALKTHCKQGHEFSEENTRDNNGSRVCRTCNTIQKRASRQRLRAALTSGSPR